MARLAFELELEARWERIEPVREAIAAISSATFRDDELRDSLSMVAVELLENAVKYGAEGAAIRCAIHGGERALVVEVTNAIVPGSPHLAELRRDLEWIQSFPAPLQAHEAALARVYESATGPASVSRLGMSRIAYAGQCTLEHELADGRLTVRARRAVGEPVSRGGEADAPLLCGVALSPAPRPPGVDDPIGESQAMRRLFDTLDRVARSSIAVLICGETGTGKEVLARAIHERSPRSTRVLRSVNCGAIPAQLVDSTLFGHERGAFTGAAREAEGVFEYTNGGTIFLDEVAELPLAAQAALLRVLESKTLTRVGGNREISVDVRVVAATHRDLEAMCAEGTFRRDLLYRLNALTLRVLPLRERRSDIAPLTEYFLRLACRGHGEARTFAPAAMAALTAYDWPGNVRELRNVVERAVVLAERSSITVDDLPENVVGARLSRVERGLPTDVPLETAPLRDQVVRHEQELIRRALDQCAGSQTQAAKLLGLPLRTLVHKLAAMRRRG